MAEVSARFIRKLAILSGRRRILLKTPSHTARIEELIHLFAASEEGPRFIHISREPQAVVRPSRPHRAEPGPSFARPDFRRGTRASDGRRILATEHSYLAVRDAVPPGWLAEIRLEDLRADPIGELRRVYAELGLPFTEAFGRRGGVSGRITRLQAQRHPPGDAERVRRLEPQLAPLGKAFHHDEPAIPKFHRPSRRIWRQDRGGCVSSRPR